MPTRYAKWLSLGATCLALTIAACGDDDAGEGTAGTGGSGGSAKAGSGGSGGAGKAGTAGTKAGSGAAGGTAPLMCGGAACTLDSTLMIVNAMAKACCTSDNKCGATNTANACLEKNAPGKVDTNCPTVNVTFMGMDYPQPGCCTPSGKCGGNFVQVMFGCTPYELLTADMGGPIAAKSCGDADAGL